MAPKKQTTALATPRVKEPWEVELENKAREDRATFQSGVPRITVDTGKDGNLTFKADGNDVGQEIVFAVVESAWSKQWYAQAYQKGVSATPDCYAFGHKEKGLVAHPNSPEPQNKQGDGSSPCDGCPHNKFGTASVGKGKACGDKPRLAIIFGHDTKEAKRASVYQLDIPAASIRNFNEYLTTLGDLTPHGNVREALTRARAQMRPGAKGHEIKFSFEGVLPGEAVQAILARGTTAYEQLTQPFPVLSEEAAQEPQKPIKGQGKRK